MNEPGPLLVSTGGGFSLRYGDRWLYSRYQPRLAAEKVALEVAAEPDTLYLLASPCLCHGLAVFAARLPPSSALFGMELDSSLLAIAGDVFADLKLDSNRFRLCTSTAPDTIATEATELGKFRRVKEVRLSGGRELHPREFDALAETITINNRLAWRNRMTLVRLGRLWVKNVIANLATLPWEQVALPRTIEKPVMLCGAGPSLNHAIPWIKKHSMHLTVMAVDTAAGALVQAGIIPDRVVCLEAQAHNLPDFTPLTGMEPTLIADISAHPASFRIVKGPKNLVSSQWMKSRFLDRLSSAGLPIQTVPPLGSVGVLAARLAVQEGQIVFLAGLDFMFQRAITHCKGSPSDLAERRFETRLYKQNGNWGLSFGQGVVPTADGNLGNAILSMYATCAGVELNGATVYDLRGGFGLPLPGTAINLDQAGDLLASRQGAMNETGYTKAVASRSAVGYKNSVLWGNAACYRSAAKTFLEDELALTRKLACSLQSTGKEALGDFIQDCDYMFAHFPDPERVVAMESDALGRLALEVGYWQNRLQMALEAMRS